MKPIQTHTKTYTTLQISKHSEQHKIHEDINTQTETDYSRARFLVVMIFLSHLTEVMVFFRLLEVKGFPLFITRSCQQVVKHMVVSKREKNKLVSQEEYFLLEMVN